MIVVKIELHSAITGKVAEIGRAHISNIGGTFKRGHYEATVFKRGSTLELRRGTVLDYPRLSYNVWRLIIRSLLACFPEESK